MVAPKIGLHCRPIWGRGIIALVVHYLFENVSVFSHPS